MEVCLVVDVANVMGSRPDGWWRDRAGAASRLLAELATLPGADLDPPDGGQVRVERMVAVVEGQARAVEDVDGIDVIRASADGDSAIVAAAVAQVAAGRTPLVVTADRGLRARLPAGAMIAGPGWLLSRLGRRSLG